MGLGVAQQSTVFTVVGDVRMSYTSLRAPSLTMAAAQYQLKPTSQESFFSQTSPARNQGLRKHGLARPACASGPQQPGGRHQAATHRREQGFWQQQQQQARADGCRQQTLEQQATDRRAVLCLLAAASASVVPARQAAAAEALSAAPAPRKVPLPVPELTETFISQEGFRFDYPAGWVVAFDRSGSTGNGAVIVVGDFRALITVSVFRTTTVAEETIRAGLSEAAGYEICVEPQQRQGSTQRFELLRSEMAPPAVGLGDAAAGGAEAAAPAYEFEYSIETCVGEVEEGLGGTLRCLGPFGNVIPTQRRRHVGRCVLVGKYAYSLNGSSPEDRWPEVGPILQKVVSTFRA